MAAAASAATPPGTVIKIRQSASSQSTGNTGYLRIVLKNPWSPDANRASVAKLLESLNTVATRNHLTEDPPVQTGDGLQFQLRQAGVPALEIEVVTSSAPHVAAGNSSVKQGSARLAIIIDDLGSDRAAAEAVFALGYPLTISVLPNHEHSTEIAEEAHRRGLQVMLHLPMQSVANETPESRELRPGMSTPEVVSLVDQFLQNVPDAAGVNNHQGSQATADATLMDELMPVLRDHRLFYVDSRTTAATVAYDTAQDFGVRAAFRNVPFLDDVRDVAAVRKQLKLALRGAREKGEAVAIGHPHPATLEALRGVLPEVQAQGVRLVLASELVH
ncbi:MAG TPA: divergent polysaccharide deacetylase family protein [Candidatus Cybelea sp.]|nr:divergent polysaccharide deacetylase family protein [Candidatus Cybelea sp.]